MFDNLQADFQHYRRYMRVDSSCPDILFIPRVLYSHPASVGIICYRLGRASQSVKSRIISKFLGVLYYSVLPFARIYSGVQISISASISPGLAILHYGGVIIAAGSKIGKDCLLHHHVNLVAYRSSSGPVIGDGFYAGVGVTVVDKVVIEDYVTAGAGSVITKSVPKNAIVGGIPAKIIRFRQENEFPSENRTLKFRDADWLSSNGNQE